MLSRHQNQIMLLLEEVVDRGHAEVAQSTLRRWYGKARLTKATFRDLSEKYAEVNDDSPLFIGDLGATYVLIYSKGLTAEDSSWFKSIDDWIAAW